MIELRASEFFFIVPGNPVSQNQAYRIITWKPKAEAAERGAVAHGSLKLTSDGAAYKVAVAQYAAVQRPKNWDRDNEYIVDAVYYFDSRRPDVDGPGKLLLDAMQDFEIKFGKKDPLVFKGLYPRDSKVWRFIQQREVDNVNPRTEIKVTLRRPWKPQQAELLGCAG
jgi:hypothetical protein